MESNFFVQFVILTVFVLLCSSHGQYYSGFHRSRYRRISSSGPNPLRYFSQPKHHGLMPGWYRNRQEYWKNHKKRFYSTEEAVENGVMPTMDTMDTGYATPDNLEDGIFQSDQTYPTSQGTLPTAMPQEPSYEQPAAMQPYPDSNTATQTPYPTLAPYSTQASYQTESMLQQYDQAPVAPVSSMLSPSAPLSQLQTQPQQQTQQQPQQITQQQQQQLTQQQPQQLPQQQPQQQQPQQLSQQQSQQQPQQQSQPQPVQPQTMQIPLPQTQSPQPQPQPAQLQPQPLSQPVLAKYPITQQAKPLSSPSPPPSIASTPHNGPYVKVKFKSKNSSRICAPGPPLKPNPRFKNCLVIGDSIAIGYLRTVKLLLREMCQVQHAPFARGSGAVDSRHGVECLSMLLKTTAMEPTHYDAIIFNFGMHDINYSKRFPEEHVSFKEYKKNLKILKQTFLATGAKVAYALTTPHISSKDRNDRIKKYNKGAISVMKSGHSVPVINLYDVIVNRCSEPGNNKFCSIMKGKGDVHYNEEGCRLLGVRVAATFATLINQRATKKHTQSRPRPRFLGQLYLDRYSSVNAVTCPDALTRCPVGTTCCESFLSLTGYGCCMMQDAVTCQDNWHCCPVGTMCSPTCNVRECHCITYLPSSKGKTIKKKIKAKVSLHGKHLKKKKKSASHPRVRVRVLKKLKRRKNRPGKHSGEAKVPNLSTMLSKHKFVKNTTDRPDNNTVELAHLIEHHHKAAYQDLKTYLSGNDAHHNHHRRRHHHHHHHHRHHQHHHNHHEQQYSHRHHHISEEDDISGSMPESTKKSNKKRKSLKIKQISNSGSESGILDDKHDLAGSAQMFNSSGEKDVMSYNDDIILGSGEEYVRGSGMRDSDDDIQGTIGNRMRNTISPVDPFDEVLKSSSKPNKGNNKTKSQSFRGKGHKRNKLKSYLSSNETVKNKYFNAPLSSGDVWNANEFSGERIALKHAAHNANANTANKNSTLHGHHAIRKTFLDSKVGLDDGENDELLSSEFEDTDGSADHDFDLMMSASTSGTKDDISNDGKENLSDEDEDEEKQSGQGEKQSGQGVNQSGQGVNQSGQEVNQSGQEVNQSGQEVSQSGQEVSQSGQEVSQSGQEVNQSGHEVNQSEQGENQSEQGENQSEQGENQSGQEVNQSGQEINQSGQEANRSNQVVNQSGQGANQSGQEVNQIGQDINQSGQGLNQSGHDINQSGQEVNQSEQEVDQSGQDIKQSGLGLNQSGHDINQSGQEVNQSEQEVNQSGQDINQSGLVLNQSGQDIDQSDQEVNQNDQGVNQSGQEENHSNQAVNQSGQAVNQSVQEVNQNDQGVNQSGQEVNQSGQEVNQSNQVVNQSGEGANQSGQEVNQSNQGANQSSQEVNQNEQGVNQSAQEVMQSGQEVNQSGKEVNHNVQENQSVQGKKQNVREENQSAEEGKTKSNYTLTPSTHYNKRPIDDHLNLMTLSKETWVRGESGGSSKDDTDDIEGRPDDNVTRIDPPSTQEASGQINKELRNELVQLDQLLEEGPSGSGGSSGEYGSSDIVENPLELNETDRDSALNTDPQTDKRLIFFKDDNRTGQSIKDKEKINSIKTVKKKIESHSSAWQNHEELMNNLEKKRVFSLNQQKSTTNSSNINVSGVNQFHEPLELEESIRNFTRKDNTVKDQQIYQSDNNVAIRAEKGQQSEVKHNLYENNSTNIVPTNRISQYFSDRGTKRINEQSNLVQLTTNHSEKRGYSENISRTQKQNQRIANNSVTEYNKQKSRTRNSSKRFSLYNNSNNNFSTNKHLISSSRGQKRNGNRLDLEKNIQEDEKLSFESNSKMDNVSSVKDDISNERLDSKHTSSSIGEDTTLEEYLHFR